MYFESASKIASQLNNFTNLFFERPRIYSKYPNWQ